MSRRAGFGFKATFGLALVACSSCSSRRAAPDTVPADEAKHTKLAVVQRQPLRPPGVVELEVRPGWDAEAGPGWVTSGYIDRLAAGLATLYQLPGEERVPGGLKVASICFRGRIPDSLADRLEALSAARDEQHYADEHTKLLDEHPDLFAATTGLSVGAFVAKMQVASTREEWQEVLWNSLALERFGLVEREDPASYAVVSSMTYVALEQQGGVLEAERLILRDAAHPDVLAFAPYLVQRGALANETIRRPRPSPQEWVAAEPPPGAEAVTYRSGELELGAWLSVPEAPGSKRPALVYFHGGFAFSSEDFAVTQPFRDAGFVVMAPTVRGENGNPGNFEMFLGEVDDAAAAIRWVAEHPEVDPERVYAFGHSAGGALAAMVTLLEDVPLTHSGSADGLFFETDFVDLAPIAPFDVLDRRQTSARVLFGHHAEMLHPHFSWSADTAAGQLVALVAERVGVDDLTGLLIPGTDHDTMLPVAVAQYLDCIERGWCERLK